MPHAPFGRVGDVGGVEGRGQLTFPELGSSIDIEDVGRVRHGEHVKLPGDDQRRDVDLFVNRELADLPQLGDGCRCQHRFETVPSLPCVVDANRPDVDALRQPSRRQHQDGDQHHHSRACEHRHHELIPEQRVALDLGRFERPYLIGARYCTVFRYDPQAFEVD
jgi:hypothetical protein